MRPKSVSLCGFQVAGAWDIGIYKARLVIENMGVDLVQHRRETGKRLGSIGCCEGWLKMKSHRELTRAYRREGKRHTLQNRGV